MKQHEIGNVVMEIKHEGGGKTYFCDDYVQPPKVQKAIFKQIGNMYVNSVLQKHISHKH